MTERTLRYPRFYDKQKVQKKTGYRYPGFIKQFIYRDDGTICYVVQADHPDFAGMLHIFSEEQLELRGSDLVKADAPSVLTTLERVYELCTTHASPDAFKNGVTDSTGTIDEGDARASDILDEVRTVIRELKR